MSGIEARADPEELRRCIRDLTALSALPAIWRAYDPHQIAESASAAMLSIIDCEVVYVSLPDQGIKFPLRGHALENRLQFCLCFLARQGYQGPAGRTRCCSRLRRCHRRRSAGTAAPS